MNRALPLCVLLPLAALASASAANVGPELYLPLPASTLPSGATSAPLTLADHLRDPDVPAKPAAPATLGGDWFDAALNKKR